MNRGPAALFGAIVAVGLGPAMWLGVRLGAVEVAPPKPPAVVSEHTSGPDRLVGGTGAGDSPIDNRPEVSATPRGRVLPLTSASSPAAAITSSPATGTPATPSSAPTTEPQSTPPTESTTAPTTPPTETTTGSTPPHDPPSGDDGSGAPGGPGAGLTESGDTGGIAAGSAVG
ncbi:hypothetical protein [Actinoplanes sp. NPDC026619]|uniref:hypothetical protein n=1 Tax=Actinoplanes sp. NPDC026619 TaxID=3155798 RepID=UPI0033F64BAB